MSQNNQPLSNNIIIPIQRVSLNSNLTSLILDSDTGDSSLTVRTGSSTSLYIDKFANVGINTSTPSSQLDIVSNNGSCLRLRHAASATAFANVFMTNAGNLSINTNASNSEIVLLSPINISNGLKLGGTLVLASADHLNATNVVAGTATASRALVLDSSLNISGINSIGTTSINVSGSVINKSIVDYLTGITAGTASPNKALVLNSSRDITGINTLSASNVIINGLDVGSAISSSGYTVDVTPGIASPSKALIVNSNRDISSINTISATTLTLGLSSLTESQVGYLTGITVGSASQNKALILNGSGAISGISSIGTSTITVGGVSIGATEASYITGITVGSANSSKALIPDSNKDITGLRVINLSGTNDLLNLSNTNTNGYVAQTFSSDTFALSIGVRGSANSTNANMAYFHYNGGYRLLINSSGEVSIGTNAFGHRLNVSGSINATNYSIAGTVIDFTGLQYVNGITVGSASNNKALILSNTGTINGINSIGTTTLSIGGTSLSSTEANYLTSVSAGTASPNKVLIPDSNRDITNLRSVSLSGTSDILSLTNTTASGYVAQTFTSDTLSLSIGIRGSTNATNPSLAYWFFNNAYRLLMNPSGDIAIGTNTFGHRLNVSGSINATNYSLGGTAIDFTGLVYVSGILAGTASNSKALVLNGSGAISGISSIGTTSLVLGGITLGSTQAGYLSGITEGIASNSKAVILSNTATISGISSLTTTTITINDITLTSTEASYISGITAGTAANNKAVILNSSGAISGIGSIGTTTLILGGRTLTSTEANYLTGITTGAGTSNKALVLDSSAAISGISSIGTSSLVLGGATLGATQAGYLTGITAGTVLANKAIIADSNRDINGLRAVSLSGTNDLLSLTNTTATGYVAQTFTSDTQSLTIGVRGSTNATNPNLAYWNYNGAYRLLMNTSGDIAIGTNTFGYRLNISGTVNATSYSLSGSALDFTGLSFITGITAGTATNSKALVLSNTGTITGISSIGVTSLVIGSNTLGATEANYLTGITAGTAANSKAIVLNSSGSITGITSLSTNTLTLGGNSLGATEAGYLTGITAGTAANSKAIVLNSSGSITGITSLSTNTLALGGNSIGATEAGYLTGITAGIAATGKAVVVDSNKDITGLRALSLAGTSDLLTLTNSSATGYVAQTLTSDTYSLSIGVRGSTNSINPNNAYVFFNGAYRLIINASGEVSIGTNTFGYRLNVNGSLNATSYLLGGTALDFTGLDFVNGITAGTATNSKALVLSNTGTITGISSLSTTALVLGSNSLTATEAGYLTSITAGTAINSKALVLSSTGTITGISSLSTTTLLLGGTSIGSTEAGYLTGITAGTPAASKVLTLDSNSRLNGTLNVGGNGLLRVERSTNGAPFISVNGTSSLSMYHFANGDVYFGTTTANALVFQTNSSPRMSIGSNGAITGITSLTTTNLVLGTVNLTSTEGSYLTSITAGTASNGKALVLNSSGGIEGITSLSTTTLSIGSTAVSASAWGTTGIQSKWLGATYTNSSSAASSIVVDAVFNSIGQPILASTNTNVTTTNASTLYIENAPTAGTNSTITNAYALNVNNGIVRIGSTSASTSTTTGALIVSGGVGIAGAIFSGNNITTSGDVIINSSTASSSSSTGALVTVGGAGIGGAIVAGGAIRTTNSTASTSTTSGSLIAGGGAGIAGAIFAGGAIRTTSTTASTSTTTGSLIAGGGVGITGAVYIGGVINSTNTTDIGVLESAGAVSASSGSVVIAGGMRVAKSLSANDTIVALKLRAVQKSNAASIIGNWDDAGYWGFGENGSTNAIRLGMCDGEGVWSGARADLSLGTLFQSSDYRLKDNIVDLEYGLKQITNLRPVKYILKTNGVTQIGFIAHETQLHLPEVVIGEKDMENEYQSINYSGIIPVVVNAIKQQQIHIEEQSKLVTKLKSENDQLKTQLFKIIERLDALESKM